MPLAFLGAIVAFETLTPARVHVGTLLIVAPALAAALAGPLLTGTTGALTVVALLGVNHLRGGLASPDLDLRLGAVVLVSALFTTTSYLRERRRGELDQVRRVSIAAQQAVVRPLPRRIGPLHLACCYLAADDQAQIGGDLYAAVRTRDGTRLIIGDVMGKGVTAIGETSLLLGAFRADGHRTGDLPDLMARLEAVVLRNLPGAAGEAPAPSAGVPEDAGPEEPAEVFITALVVGIPDDRPEAELVCCGHPPPLLLHGDRVITVAAEAAAPLGLGDLAASRPSVGTFPFRDGDILLLYTDGVAEARDAEGTFYPLAERVARAPRSSARALVRHLREDLLAHAGGRLGDDAALLAVERRPAPCRDIS